MWCAVHYMDADHGGAVAHNDAIDVANPLNQLTDSRRGLVRAERLTSLQMQPFPGSEGRETLQVRWQEVHVPHLLVTDQEHLWAGSCHMHWGLSHRVDSGRQPCDHAGLVGGIDIQRNANSS